MDSARLTVPVGACAALVALAGCGSDNSYKNNPRPPAPIVITAAITPDRVSISPTRFGAGPVSLVVTNQTDRSQRLTISQRINGQSQDQEQTAPINPHDTGTLQASLGRGSYTVRAEGDGARPAHLVVGHERPSAQNDLLQP